MRMKTFCLVLLSTLYAMPSLWAQPRIRPRPGRDNKAPHILTWIPSSAGGDSGIAVGVLPPLRQRYDAGAPVLIHVPGGVSKGETQGKPEYAGLGFVEIWFLFPGGEEEDASSGGIYDTRGPNCIRALADVIRFATGRLPDRQGRKISDLVSTMPVLTQNVGLEGSSHGGNACGVVMAAHGDEFPDLAFYASMESPYGEGNVNVELGSKDQGVHPAYDPETGTLDLSKLSWADDVQPGPARRWREEGSTLKGALFFDLDKDKRFTESRDDTANAFVLDAGQGPKAWYSPRLLREAESRHLIPDPRPSHIPSLEESKDYWKWRDAAPSIPLAVKKCPKVAVIVYANEKDHVQAAPDHPHILTQVEGFRMAGARFIRLNPDRAYVRDFLPTERPMDFPDNAAGIPWDRASIRTGLEPEGFPVGVFMKAAVCELADRVQSDTWAPNLEAVLFPDAPHRAGPGLAGADRPMLPPRDLRNREAMRREKKEDVPAQGEEKPARLKQTLSADAGSVHTPLLFCIGVHVEPLGAQVSTKVPAAGRSGEKILNEERPSYEREMLFKRHREDLKTLAEIVARHSGCLTVQAQTPFTERLVESGDSLLSDLEKRGNEVALHFHENAHLGPEGDALPVEVWADVMGEEISWLKKAGATRIRLWTGGNLFPGVLEAAHRVGLETMTDYKNRHTQKDDDRLLSVNPWRPAQGPAEGDLAGFAGHDPGGDIVYLPNGVFERVDHSAMRRSEDLGGDYPYFDAMTRGLELSLKAARPDRVNVFHITVHPGEFRGGPDAARPFSVIDDWLSEILDPAVKSGRVRWATFSQMAEAYEAWEKGHPGESPRL